MPCALGVTAPSTQSIVLIVIQLMADSRRHNYQHQYYNLYARKNQPLIFGWRLFLHQFNQRFKHQPPYSSKSLLPPGKESHGKVLETSQRGRK